jgi:hypothetical protein
MRVSKLLTSLLAVTIHEQVSSFAIFPQKK